MVAGWLAQHTHRLTAPSAPACRSNYSVIIVSKIKLLTSEAPAFSFPSTCHSTRVLNLTSPGDDSSTAGQAASRQLSPHLPDTTME